MNARTNSSIASTVVLCIMTCSCGVKHTQTDNVPSRGAPAARQSDSIKDHSTNSLASADQNPLTQVAQKSADGIIKAMDDFSAALKLQYARFSYDTNCFLTVVDTNYLVNLPVEEFRDFMFDFKKAVRMRGLMQGECALLYEMIMDRINSGLGTPQWSYVSDALCCLTEIAGQNNDAEVMQVPSVWLEYAYKQASLTKDLFWFRQALAGVTFPLVDLQDDTMIEKYAKTCSGLVDEYQRRALIVTSPEYEMRLKFTQVYLKSYTNPKAAIAELNAMQSDFNKVFQGDRLLEIFKWNSEGMNKGMFGKALDHYVSEKRDKSSMH